MAGSTPSRKLGSEVGIKARKDHLGERGNLCLICAQIGQTSLFIMRRIKCGPPAIECLGGKWPHISRRPGRPGIKTPPCRKPPVEHFTPCREVANSRFDLGGDFKMCFLCVLYFYSLRSYILSIKYVAYMKSPREQTVNAI